ncbi:hypothetical protein ASE23_28045 [Rhizobium sp. Root73]|nr:hypothetical protein ASE23_28045 [Rhizobium sp. Root73]
MHPSVRRSFAQSGEDCIGRKVLLQIVIVQRDGFGVANSSALVESAVAGELVVLNSLCRGN